MVIMAFLPANVALRRVLKIIDNHRFPKALISIPAAGLGQLTMGVRMDTSIRTGCIERGWWYLSGVPGVQNAFTNRWMKQQGLVSVKELWSKIHYGKNARPAFAS
jgi:hypothetical protein